MVQVLCQCTRASSNINIVRGFPLDPTSLYNFTGRITIHKGICTLGTPPTRLSAISSALSQCRAACENNPCICQPTVPTKEPETPTNLMEQSPKIILHFLSAVLVLSTELWHECQGLTRVQNPLLLGCERTLPVQSCGADSLPVSAMPEPVKRLLMTYSRDCNSAYGDNAYSWNCIGSGPKRCSVSVFLIENA